LDNTNGTPASAVLFGAATSGILPGVQGVAATDQLAGSANVANPMQIGGFESAQILVPWPGIVRQATAGNLSQSDDAVPMYAGGEGKESDVLLTSFGIAVPLPAIDEDRPPLADVFVLNGPGFATDGEVLSLREESLADRPAEVAGVTMPFAPLTNGGPVRAAQLAGGAFPHDGTVVGAGLSSFSMMREEVFVPDHLDGLAWSHGSSFEAVEPAMAPPSQSKEQDDQAKEGHAQSSLFFVLPAFGVWLGSKNDTTRSSRRRQTDRGKCAGEGG
jgi:hypothetical protein